MPNNPSHLSRRGFVSTGGTLLAAFGLSAALPGGRAAAEPAGRPTSGTGARQDLALHRPVAASSTAYAATQPSFAVDRVARAGVRGSGWRAEQGDAQWIAVDLQATCQVESVTLVFEATADDPPFVPADGDPWANTTGTEILSSAATAFRIETSPDGTSWRTVHETADGTGGVVDITLDEPVEARWVRMSATKRSSTNPLGLNGFQVYGTAPAHRPPAVGWTAWEGRKGPVPALTADEDGSVPVESGWDLTLDDWAGTADGAELSKPGQDTSGWLPATVPGTVLASLVEQGHLPDPVFGMNNLHVPEALSRHSWWYRRQFALPPHLDTGPGRRVWLEFDGINHEAEVWLNGTSVGTLLHPFARAAFDVTDALDGHAGAEQALAVRITPMPHPGSPGDKGPDGNAFVQSATLYMDSPTYLSASGWDWMPAVRDRAAGIWNHVRLRSTGAAVIGDPRVVTRLPDLPDTSTAELTVTVPVRNADSASRSVTVRASFGDVAVASTVTVAAGATEDVLFTPKDHPQLRLHEPKLWWPNGYGPATLHDLRMTASVGGAESDRRTVRFGIREFGYAYDLPVVIDPATDSATQTVDFDLQHSRHLRLLCGKRATGWGDSLWSLSVLRASAPGTDLARGSTATASSVDSEWNGPQNAVDGDPRTRWSSSYDDDQWIRLDLGSVVDFDRVVLVWEQAYAMDFTVQVSEDGGTWTDVKKVSNAPVPLRISVNGVPVFCRGGNWGWDELLRRMVPDRMNAVMAMHRDMNFTMIRNWIGSSTREEFYAACDENGILVWNDFWEAGPFLQDPPHYADIARDTILRYRIHPCIAVWCAANEEQPPAAVAAGIQKAIDDLDDEILYLPDSAAGFVSGHGPYYWVDPASYFDPHTYDTGNFGFHTEIGIPTVPVADSMRNLVGDGDPGWPIATPWYHHDWSAHGNQRPDTYLGAVNDRLDTSSSLDEFCRKAQFVNYESMRAMFEAWNAHLWQDANALLLWMSHPAWHSTVWQTYDYDLDVNGSYYGARKGCEPLHVQAGPDGRVLVANHTAAAVTGAKVTAQLYDLGGRTLGDPVTTVLDVAPSGTADAFTVPFDRALPSTHLLRLRLTDAHGGVLSSNDYCRYRKATDVRSLNGLPNVRLSVRTRPAGRSAVTATVRNTGAAPAAMVRLSLVDPHSGSRVLPALADDNYLWLLPGESRDITLSWAVGIGVARTPAVAVEAYNAPRVTV
jgi:Exo-beta-D-glucosaminidase Ig-fold domain/F5/8 type C domain/Glycosyl hydrolases family 2